MGWQDEVRAVEARMTTLIHRVANGLAEFPLLAQTSPLGDADTVQATDADRTKQRPVRRVEPWGHRGRAPTDGVRGFLIKVFGSASGGVLAGVAADKRYGPQNLDVGESAQYSAVNPLAVYADKSGHTKITSGTPQGGSQGDVQVNGGMLKVVRDGDRVDLFTVAATFNGSGAITVLVFTPIVGGGAPVTIAVATPTGTLTGHGKANGSSPNFKA